MATEATVVEIDRGRIKELADREEKRLDERTRRRGPCTSAPARPCPAASPPPTRCATRGRSTSTAAPARRSGTSTGTSCSTSTTASARWCRATPTPRSARRSRSATRRGRTSPPRPRTASWSPRSSSAAGASAVALYELGLRGDHGRDPHRPGGDGPGHDHEDLRLLPRPPRLRDGLDRRPVRPHRPARQPRVAAVRRRDPAGCRGPDHPGAVQRRAGDGEPHRAPDRGGPQARLRDHGGGDDEPRGRAPGAGLSRGRPRADEEARHHPHLRRGEDRPLHRARRAPPSASASCPTW